MGDIIALLPDYVANQIAAGEVVQRPSSVVKELLENSIDAGATSIQLIVEEGGKLKIQVVDNGIGMTETDARMAFERHATSKIKSTDDIFSIITKGFRGEALASVSAVAKITLQTRKEDAELGTEIKIEGSEIIHQKPTTCAKGTSISVDHLFFNVPARKNFLKSDRIEFKHILKEFYRVVLAHPGIDFTLVHNGKTIHQLQSSNHKKRILSLFGGKIGDKIVPIEDETDILKIEGFIGRATESKKQKGEQFFFVNDRFIQSSYLNHAVMSAYEGLLSSGYYPSYFIYLNLDAKKIDINIHPSKTEIKFEDERIIYQLLQSAVKKALGLYQVKPSLDFDQNPNDNLSFSKSKPIKVPKIEVDPSFNPFKQETFSSTKYSSSSPSKSSSYSGGKTTSSINQFEESSQFFSAIDEDAAQLKIENIKEEKSFFQIHKKWMVSLTKTGMFFVHQSRAHQRILFEEFLNQKFTVEKLIFPISIPLTSYELQLLKIHSSTIEDLGLKINLNEEGLEIFELPQPLKSEDVKDLVLNLISDLSELEQSSESIIQRKVAEIISRKSAIKSGQKLSNSEMQHIFDALFALPNPERAVDGKSTFRFLELGEFEKKLEL